MDVNFVLSHAVEGKILPTEKACFLSHKKAIERSLEGNQNVLILEDDAQFGPNSFNFLKILDDMQDDSTDIVFTDICVGGNNDMIELFFLRKNLIRDSTFQLIDLKDFFWAGATSYLIFNQAKRKILNLIETLHSYNLPYDLQLRQWINDEKLNAKFIFPFATTVSKLSASSNIQTTGNNQQISAAASDAFRRLVWADSERISESPIDGLSKIEEDFFDARTSMFTRILSVFLYSVFNDNGK
ncbi:hypothetical protein AGMMS50256_26830 [Betaproteobacteria bacterium]|nr:hypothetical protein AGMMS50256_26830 [Betaproteobacteria bacterium]